MGFHNNKQTLEICTSTEWKNNKHGMAATIATITEHFEERQNSKYFLPNAIDVSKRISNIEANEQIHHENNDVKLIFLLFIDGAGIHLRVHLSK